MKFLWSIALGLALSCFSGDAFGIFGKTTEKELFEAITTDNHAKAIEMIDKKSAWGVGKATNLEKTADEMEIQQAVPMTTLKGAQVDVKKLQNITPLILAVLLGRSNIIKKLIEEYQKNNRSIGFDKKAILTGSDKTSKIRSFEVSAIDVARILGNQNLVKKLIDKKIGSDNDINIAKVWLQGIKAGTQSGAAADKPKLGKKLKTLQESLTKLKAKLNQLTQSLQQLKAGLTT